MQHGLYAVIASEARDKLFSGMPAVGESIRIDGVTFRGDRRGRAAHAGGRQRQQPRRLYSLQLDGCPQRQSLPRRNLARLRGT